MPNLRCCKCDKFAHASEISALENKCQRCFILPVCFAEPSANIHLENENSPKRNTVRSVPESVVIALTASSSTTFALIADLIRQEKSSGFVRLSVTVIGLSADKVILSFDLVNNTGDFLNHVGAGEFSLGEAGVFPAKQT